MERPEPAMHHCYRAPKAEKVRSDVEPQQFNIRSGQPATGQDPIALPMARRVALSR
jgi:hypothetical protein